MSILTVPYNFTPRPYQLAFYNAMDGVKGKPDTKRKRAVLCWHRRAGKDKCCWCYLIKEAALTPGNYFYIFPTGAMARRALWENVDNSGFELLKHIPKKLIAKQNDQEMLIKLTNGSTIRIVGFDINPDSIRGVACKGAVLSEFAFSDPEPYKILMPSVKESNGFIIFNSTPNGRNHFYDLWKRVQEPKNWFTSKLQTLYPERDGYSHLLSPKDIKEIKDEEGLSQEDIEREYGCSFATGMQGSFYMNSLEKAYNENRISEFVYDDTLKVDTFWDIGIDDSTAVWFRQKINNKIIFIDYFEDSGKSLQFYVKMLEDKGYTYGTHYLPHDANHRSIQTGNSTANIFEDLLRETRISSDVWVLERLSVQNGINSVRARFPRYHFNSGRCAEGVSKLELYHRRWDKKRAVFLKEPVHDCNSHAADSLRMEAISEDIRHDGFYKQNNFEAMEDFNVFD